MNDIKTRASILVTCFFLMATMAITPILGVIANTFPETGPVAIQVISTLPNLFVIIFTLLAGVLATRFAKKTISLIGLFLLVIAGVGGYLFHGSVGALYFWAAIIGVGMGLFSPMVTLLINYNYEGAERGKMFGWQTSFTNAGAIILSLLGGFLGKMVFHTAYLSYVIFVIPVFIIVAICLKKDVPVVSSRTRSGLKIDGTVIYYLIIITIFIMIYNAYATNVAMFALENQLGDTSTAGIANSVALVGGIVGGFLFGPIGKKLGKHMMTLGLFMCAMGFLLTYMAATLTVALLAAFIAGISISFFMPSVTFSAAAEIKDEYKTMGLSLVATIGSLGAFLSPIIFTNLAIALGDATTKFRFLLVGIIAVTLSVVFFIMFQVQKSTKEAV